MQRLGYVPALDGIRGVAIALVIATHYWGLPGGGPLGVGLFFVLSGFLITTLLLEELDLGRLSLRNFYARRCRRLLPALALLLAVYVVVRGEPGLQVAALGGLYGGNIVEAFWPSSPVTGSALAHLWSLAQEEQFYLVWPLLLVLLARGRRLLILLCTLTMALIAYRAVIASGGTLNASRTYAPDFHSDWLLAGAVLAVVRRRGFRWNEAAALGAFVTILVGSIVNPWTQAWFVWQAPIFMVGCALLVGAAHSQTQMAGLLSVRPLVLLGEISYSLYLWHVPVFAVFGYRHPFLALPVSLAAAGLSYRFVEQPFRRRRRVTREAPAPVIAASPTSGIA
jgi:peptidoglycan/LPS O-acetylase OafA/YrhL